MIKTILITLLAGFTLLTATSCSKKNQKGEVIRNCTGDYMKINKDHYRVFNPIMLENFESGDQIEFSYTFDKPDQQTSADQGFICEMYFPYKDDIYITEVH